MSSPESRIDLACDRFEAAWKAGQRPRIEAYLAESPEPERAKLFGQLLRVELELRRRGGEAPTAEEYHLRFPDYSEAISRLFREEPSPPPDGSRPQPPEAPYHGNGPAPKDDPGATISEDRPLSFSVLTTAGEIRPLLGPSEIAALQAEFAPGVLIQNRYVLERELGAGGMGQVFLGHDDRLGRRVAIKVILPPDRRRGGYDPAHEARLREAFFEEARLGANLTHPAIATVFDFGLQGNKPFTVFEYIPGETLRALLRRRGSLPLEEVRLIIGPLAQALDFAHSRQVVHRDLKPENIRATEQGQFKILDLGLAKEFCREVDWSFAGTPAYASPEQAAGLACDGRTDQYALALIAFEMLTGRKLFEGRDPMVLLEQHRSQTLVWTDGMTRDIPDAVRDALGRALRKDPNRRFATCQEFAVAIGCQLLNTPVPLPEVILETEVERITSSWLSQYISFGRNTRSVHLVLTRDALWSAYHGEIQQIPLRTVEQFRPLITARDLGTAVSTAVAITDAEAIRRVNGSGEAHNLTLGVLDYPALFALALALCGISLSAESVEATTPVSLGLLEL
ncbi:MAG TPA: serine/threonine-protein kinase, partial [Isosphaeraceae bacterium]